MEKNPLLQRHNSRKLPKERKRHRLQMVSTKTMLLYAFHAPPLQKVLAEDLNHPTQTQGEM